MLVTGLRGSRDRLDWQHPRQMAKPAAEDQRAEQRRVSDRAAPA